MGKTVLTVCLNPTLQRTLVFDRLQKGEVNRAREGRLDASGKGVNVSRVIDQYGDPDIRSRHLTHGSGEGAPLLATLCKKDNIDLTMVQGGGVRTCTTSIDLGDSTVTELIEPAEKVDATTVQQVQRSFEQMIGNASLLVLSGSTAPGYPEDLFARFCEISWKAEVPVVADFRGKMLLLSLSSPPSLVKINLLEFASTFQLSGADRIGEQDDDRSIHPPVKDKLKELSEKKINFVLSRGSKESISYDRERDKLIKWNVHKVKAVNTIGCGDAFTAGLALSLVKRMTLSEGIRLGHDLAARNAVLLKPGALKQ